MTTKRNYYHFMQNEWYQKIRYAIIVDRSNLFLNKDDEKRSAISKLFVAQPKTDPNIDRTRHKNAYDPIVKTKDDPPLVCKRKWIESYNGFCIACRCISNHCMNPTTHFKTKKPPDGYKLPDFLHEFATRLLSSAKTTASSKQQQQQPPTSLGERYGLTYDAIILKMMGPNYVIVKQKERRVRMKEERQKLQQQQQQQQQQQYRWPPTVTYDWADVDAFPKSLSCNKERTTFNVIRK